MSGCGKTLIVNYHLFFSVESSFALRADSIEFIVASVDICLCIILLLLHMLSSVIQGIGSGQTVIGYWRQSQRNPKNKKYALL